MRHRSASGDPELQPAAQQLGRVREVDLRREMLQQEAEAGVPGAVFELLQVPQDQQASATEVTARLSRARVPDGVSWVLLAADLLGEAALLLRLGPPADADALQLQSAVRATRLQQAADLRSGRLPADVVAARRLGGYPERAVSYALRRLMRAAAGDVRGVLSLLWVAPRSAAQLSQACAASSSPAVATPARGGVVRPSGAATGAGSPARWRGLSAASEAQALAESAAQLARAAVMMGARPAAGSGMGSFPQHVVSAQLEMVRDARREERAFTAGVAGRVPCLPQHPYSQQMSLPGERAQQPLVPMSRVANLRKGTGSHALVAALPPRWRQRCEELCPKAWLLYFVRDGPAAGALLNEEAAARLETPETLCEFLARVARERYLEAEGLVELEELPGPDGLLLAADHGLAGPASWGLFSLALSDGPRGSSGLPATRLGMRPRMQPMHSAQRPASEAVLQEVAAAEAEEEVAADAAAEAAAGARGAAAAPAGPPQPQATEETARRLAVDCTACLVLEGACFESLPRRACAVAYGVALRCSSPLVEQWQEHADTQSRALNKLRPRLWEAVGADVLGLLRTAGLSEAAEQLERAAATLPAAERQVVSAEQQEAAELERRAARAQECARLQRSDAGAARCLQEFIDWAARPLPERADWLLERLRADEVQARAASSDDDRMLLAAASIGMLSRFEPERVMRLA
eukprot:scaffold24.g2931.t1